MIDLLRVPIGIFLFILVIEFSVSEDVRDQVFELVNLVFKKFWSIF